MVFRSNIRQRVGISLLLLLVYSYTSFLSIPLHRKRRPQNKFPFRPSKRDSETCLQWHGALKHFGGSIHYVLIGAQKAGTSTLSKFIRFHQHAQKVVGTAPKEFHLFDELVRGSGNDSMYVIGKTNSSVSSLMKKELFNDGIRKSNYSAQKLQRNSDKVLHGDATPRYLMSEEVARIIHLLHPHAKILISLREPAARAVSHLRMFAEYGKVENNSVLGQYFDVVLVSEMDAAVSCGWEVNTGTFRDSDSITSFSEFANCVRTQSDARIFSRISKSTELLDLHAKIQRDWFVLRGLYAEMIPSWINYFPVSRIKIFHFSQIICNMPDVLRRLEKFLCLPQFNDFSYERARKYHLCGNALSKHEIQNTSTSPSAEVLNRLRMFYKEHNHRLGEFLNHYFPEDNKIDWAE